ncbi:MAG: hypothetical protein NZ529_00625 [Cytophagaceae bacterium]|nr:hypothetical protein [Cytophagaceae bacterium]MDW8455268.1 hypothetical protein [Cytophagaceae bacterium]
MKKCIIIIVALINLSFLSIAQTTETYWVLHVMGNVITKATGKSLKVGDKITNQDQLKFSDKNASVVVMGPKGKYTLKQNPKASPNEFVAFANNSLMPMKSSGHLSSYRQSGPVKASTYFGDKNFNIIGQRIETSINCDHYAFTDQKYLELQYRVNGQLQTRKLIPENNKIIVDRSKHFTAPNNQPYDMNKVDSVKIFLVDLTNNTREIETTFKLNFIDEKKLKDNLIIQKNIYKEMGKTDQEIESELVGFVNSIYDKTDQRFLKSWIKSSVMP